MKIAVGVIAIVGILLGIYVFRSKSKANRKAIDRYTCQTCGDRDCVCHKEEHTG